MRVQATPPDRTRPPSCALRRRPDETPLKGHCCHDEPIDLLLTLRRIGPAATPRAVRLAHRQRYHFQGKRDRLGAGLALVSRIYIPATLLEIPFWGKRKPASLSSPTRQIIPFTLARKRTSAMT